MYSLLRQMRSILESEFQFFSAGPNHRDFSEWYDSDLVFQGHVREPVIRDFRELMDRNRLELIATYGRNFIGAETHKLPWLSPAFVKTAVHWSDNILRFLPTLCSDIHILGRK